MRLASSDFTTQARIRESALSLFGESGPDATSVRTIAEKAGVSAALVIHHFGSKAGLIRAVDDFVLERFAHYVAEVGDKTSAEDAKAAVVAMAEEPILFAYLARALTQTGEAGVALFSRLFDITVRMLKDMIEAGVCRPVDDLEATAAWLLTADLGVMVLRHHLDRTLGQDPYSPEGLARIAAVEFDVTTNALLSFSEEETQ